MKEIRRKITSTIMAALIFVGALPTGVVANAQTTDCDGNFEYEIVYTDEDNRDYIELTRYIGGESECLVPSELDGKIVRGLNGTFNGSEVVKAVYIEDGIEYIDGRAFACIDTGLEVRLPESLRCIGNEVFYHSEVNRLNLPKGLLGIGVNAFLQTTFADTEIKLPKHMVSLSALAFAKSNITSVSIGADTEYVSGVYNHNTGEMTYTEEPLDCFSAFSGCTELVKISVSPENNTFSAVDNSLYSKDGTMLLCYGGGGRSVEEFVIPEGVHTLANYSFMYCDKIGRLVVSEKVERLVGGVFYGSTLDEIVFDENCRLRELPAYAFSKTVFGKRDMVIPDFIEVIGNGAFSGSNITSLSFEENSGCRSIGADAFKDCTSLKSVVIPKSVEVMGNPEDTGKNASSGKSSRVFMGCTSLESFTLEDNSRLKHLTTNSFDDCYKLSSLEIGENSALTSILSTFRNSSLTTLDLSSCGKLSFISRRAFSGCKGLESVNLENTHLSTIEEYCFSDCSALRSVSLSEYTNIINDYAFSGCSALEDIDITNVAIIAKTAFNKCRKLSIDFNEAPMVYNDFVYTCFNNHITITGYTGTDKELVIPSHINDMPVVAIAAKAFKDIPLDTVELPDTLVSIGNAAFKGCKIKQAVTFPEGLRYIGDEAFMQNELAGDIYLPDNIDVIKQYSFYGIRSDRLYVGSGTTDIEQCAFYGAAIKELYLSDSVEEIAKNALAECYYLEKLYLGAGVRDIENIFNSKHSTRVYGFEVSEDNDNYSSADGVLYNKDKTVLISFPYSENDASFTMPESVLEISPYAFYERSISDIVLSEGLKAIGENAFEGVYGLKEIYIPSSVEDIGNKAFYYCDELERVELGAVHISGTLESTFYNCFSLKSVIIDRSAYINHFLWTFRNTALESFVFPDNVSIITSAFLDVKTIKHITLPERLPVLTANALASCGVESIVIPSGVSTLQQGCFGNCESLSYVNLSNVKAIEQGAFRNCKALESIDLTGVGYVSPTAFEGCDNLKKFYFTAEEKEAYIAEQEFRGNETLESVVIGSSITEIQDYAFADCVKLETAFIAEEIEEISDTAFDNCDMLTIICIDNSPAMLYAQRNNIRYQSVETFVIAPVPDQIYTGRAITPSLNVSQGGRRLTSGTDYTTTYKDNINIGRAKAIVTGLGDYCIFGSTVNFNIVKAAEPTTTPTQPTSKPTTQPTTKPATQSTTKPTTQPTTQPTSKPTTQPTTQPTTKPTTQPTTKPTTQPTSKPTAQPTTKPSAEPALPAPTSIVLSKTAYVYDGKVKKPSVKVKDADGNTVSSKYYTVKYSGGRKNVGEYKVTVRFRGKYQGTRLAYFTIKPRAVKIKSVKKNGKGFTVKWKRRKAQTSGYQLQYSTSKGFTGSTLVTIKGNAKVSRKIKADKGHKYYVRVRAYKTVNGKKYYSKWSKVNSIKLK